MGNSKDLWGGYGPACSITGPKTCCGVCKCIKKRGKIDVPVNRTSEMEDSSIGRAMMAQLSDI